MENEFDKEFQDVDPTAEETAGATMPEMELPEQEIPEPDIPQPRFEPNAIPYQYPPVPPVSQPVRYQEDLKKEKKPKKNKNSRGLSGGVVVILSLCVALISGLIGAGVMHLLSDKQMKAPAPNSGTSNVFEGNREKVEIQINQIETGKVLTPAEVYAANVNSTVGITTQVSTNFWGYQTTSAASGSGFVYTDDGYILTNYHVVEDATSITVSTYDGQSLAAELIGFDESNDIAVLKVEAEGLVPVVLGDSENLNVGDSVIAIGNPLGELTFSLTAGAVSALEREITFSDGLTMSLIQTDCAINSGNSGGALFNLYGEVIGITNAKYSSNNSSASIDNIGFAIPVNRVRPIVDSIIENGYVIKPYIGVTIVDVSVEMQNYGLPQGASIRSIEAGGPAEAAGLQVNDIVTHINGEPISGSADLKTFISESKPEDVLALTVWRKGATIELTLTVGQQIQTSASQQVNQQQNEQQQSDGSGYGTNPFPFFNWG